jgi:formate dehydrogenase maturation protein FdhE
VSAFDAWRDEDHWLRNYCPTCGEPPAMAQLVGKGEQRLAVLAVEGEAGLRIDYCDVCSGYLKSYDGEGSEGVLLADWTSLHLDLIARDRGLKRLAPRCTTCSPPDGRRVPARLSIAHDMPDDAPLGRRADVRCSARASSFTR